MELLWTDFFFLTMLLIIFLISTYKIIFYSETRQFFIQLSKRPMAVSSGLVLLFFLLIGVLDSIHFNVKSAHSHHLTSLLDKLLAPIDASDEKTYSAPLSLTLYSTETVVQNGIVKQIYPRLSYPPVGINKAELIQRCLWQALMIALITGICGYFLINGWAVFSKKKLIFHKGLAAGLISLFFCVFIAYFSYRLSRYFHVFGTGKIGQDIFYFTLKSVRTGLIIGTLTSLFMLPLAVILGIAAGYFGGIIDDMIQYLYITLSSIPGVLLITASVLSLQTYIANHPHQFPSLDSGADARLLALCAILGVTSWTSLCRILRAEALKLRAIDFVQAARALGSSSMHIVFHHLIPNVMPIVIMTVVLDFSFLVLSEAVLSYVGVGVSPMTISWGNMINGARLELARDPIVWWPMLAAFIGMFSLVLASNLFADAIRDGLDPHAAKF